MLKRVDHKTFETSSLIGSLNANTVKLINQKRHLKGSIAGRGNKTLKPVALKLRFSPLFKIRLPGENKLSMA